MRGRELDVRTNAICMILHVLARPGAAPIGFQLSAYVFCLLFWLRHGRHAGARIGKRGAGGGQRRGAERKKKEREREVADGGSNVDSTRKEIILLGFSRRTKMLVDREREGERESCRIINGQLLPQRCKTK